MMMMMLTKDWYEGILGESQVGYDDGDDNEEEDDDDNDNDDDQIERWRSGEPQVGDVWPDDEDDDSDDVDDDDHDVDQRERWRSSWPASGRISSASGLLCLLLLGL